jgi:DNA-binding transcriptional MerR regulator
MALKMKELMELSGESKSTILYYLKEGLLPKPQKPKPNVHLYDDSSIQIIKFIKYLQNNYSYSISQIKNILQNNNFSFDNSFNSILDAIVALQGEGDKRYTKDELINILNIKEEELDSFIKDGLILKKDIYVKKDLDALNLLLKAKEMGLDFKLFKEYAKSAKELAKLENEIGYSFLEDDSTPHNKRYELLFDIILNYKPYIFNSYTINEHKERVKL